MGIFSGIKKAVKKVFKGVKKVFKKAGKFVGKVLGSKWGKALMLAAAVVTGGLAIAGGVGAFTGQAAGASFMTKFVAGAKGFVGALLNPVAAGKGALSAAQAGTSLTQGVARGVGALEGVAAAAGGAAGVTPGVDAAAVLEGGAATATPGAVAPAASTAGLEGAGAVSPLSASTPMAPVVEGTPAWVSPAEKAGGMLKKAAGKAYDFATSTGGGLVLANAAQGYAAGKAQEDMLKKGDYYDRQWADPRQNMLLDAAARVRPKTPEGYAERSRRMDRDTNRFQSRYTKSGAAG
jgi:hypothetical protein